jgi:hypothetical protein
MASWRTVWLASWLAFLRCQAVTGSGRIVQPDLHSVLSVVQWQFGFASIEVFHLISRICIDREIRFRLFLKA